MVLSLSTRNQIRVSGLYGIKIDLTKGQIHENIYWGLDLDRAFRRLCSLRVGVLGAALLGIPDIYPYDFEIRPSPDSTGILDLGILSLLFGILEKVRP